VGISAPPLNLTVTKSFIKAAMLTRLSERAEMRKSSEGEYMKKIQKTNPNLVSLIKLLQTEGYHNNVPLWIDISKRLSRPTRHKAEVNLSKINRYTEEGETVIVPGKVLGAGVLDHTVIVSAFAFSQSAREQINAKGRTLTIQELLKENPQGKGVKILE
jgi:large subunit ribosomal protein L18e